MKLNDLKNTVKRPNRRRVGRGDGSGSGRTSGRGEKGAGARTGHTSRPFFEGGQIPLIRRIPKRGFNNPNHTEYEVVNLKTLEENFKDGESVDRVELQKRGLVGKNDLPLKILGDGELTKALKEATAVKFSKSAKEKIEAKGGKCIEKAARKAAAEA